MHLILLPGNSAVNKPWIEQVSQKLEPLFDSTHVQYYDHWDQSAGLKVAAERKKLQATAEKFSDYVVFAKSAGVFLAIDSVQKDLIHPQSCIFTGTTARSARMLGNWHIPTFFIQETSDPFLSFSDLKKTLSSSIIKDYQLEEVPGSNHSYQDIDTIKNLTQRYHEQVPDK